MNDNRPALKPTLDQRRASHAWARIKDLLSTGADKGVEPEEYAREAKKLPVRIMTSGLGQALAFLEAKQAKKPSLQRLTGDLTDWVIRQRPMEAKNRESLLESVIQGDAQFLRLATDETLAYLQWLNRFAEAKIKVDARED